jgi:DNA polymerase III subunit beta
MKLECLKDTLASAISKAQAVTGKNATTPILKCLLLEAKDSSLTIRATNLDLGVEITIPVKIETEGTVAVLGQTLNSFISTLDKEKNINLTANESTLTISSSKTSAQLKTFPTEDYPIIPKVEGGKKFTISSKDIVKGLRSVGYSAAVSSMKPELSSIFIYPDNSTLVFVATDSFRLAEKRIITKQKFDFEQILIPFRNIGDIIRILDEKNENITVCTDKNQISFSLEGVYIVSRAVDGTFPSYKQIIPKENQTEATVLKQDFINALKTSHIFSDAFNRVTLNIDPIKKRIDIKTKNTEIGENETMLEGNIKGEALNISFNYKNINDCFQSIESDSLILSFDGINRPLVIRGVGDNSFFYLAMPMNK